jgi:hypothetical protein
MNSIEIKTTPTPERNVVKAIVDFRDFDPFGGITLRVSLFNDRGQIFDRIDYILSGDDWQNWPASTTPEEDYNYIEQFVIKKITN